MGRIFLKVDQIRISNFIFPIARCPHKFLTIADVYADIDGLKQ